MKYEITREFLSGDLKGMNHTEVTRVKFDVGFICKKSCLGPAYKIITCKEIMEDE